jgi:hypothetical protein
MNASRLYLSCPPSMMLLLMVFSMRIHLQVTLSFHAIKEIRWRYFVNQPRAQEVSEALNPTDVPISVEDIKLFSEKRSCIRN